MNDTYVDYLNELCEARAKGAQISPGTVHALATAPGAPDSPPVLLFSPHPDDECITGGLAFRLRHQAGVKVVNVAVTLGSRVDRRRERKAELENACRYLGFDLVLAEEDGFSDINAPARAKERDVWAGKVARIAELLAAHQPAAILFPHAGDWNSTHIGTHLLVMDALESLPASTRMLLVETEYWGQLPAPNLLVESTPGDVAALVAATSCHVGEVARNPYHLSLPFWMHDNVRRGAEIVGGQGGAAPDLLFGTLYRVSSWYDSAVRTYSGPAGIFTADMTLESLTVNSATT